MTASRYSLHEQVGFLISTVGVIGPVAATLAMAVGVEWFETAAIMATCFAPFGVFLVGEQVRRRSRLGIFAICSASAGLLWLAIATAAAAQGTGPVYRQLEWIDAVP